MVFHLIHGEQDGVIRVEHASAAAESLTALGNHVTLDAIPDMGHGINQPMLERAIAHLRQDIALS
ncbi:esterase YpfH [Yersinia enterocolitica]|nr:esterase YpfH [Yersinia enterocolitica]